MQASTEEGEEETGGGRAEVRRGSRRRGASMVGRSVLCTVYFSCDKNKLLTPTLSDTTLLKKLTGYNPKTNYKTGIKKFLEWYLEYYN